MYILSFDRAGYGESDPNPERSVKSEALDIQELADRLQLGPTFYLIGTSIGTYPVWASLKYIPHRHIHSLFYPLLVAMIRYSNIILYNRLYLFYN